MGPIPAFGSKELVALHEGGHILMLELLAPGSFRRAYITRGKDSEWAGTTLFDLQRVGAEDLVWCASAGHAAEALVYGACIYYLNEAGYDVDAAQILAGLAGITPQAAFDIVRSSDLALAVIDYHIYHARLLLEPHHALIVQLGHHLEAHHRLTAPRLRRRLEQETHLAATRAQLRATLPTFQTFDIRPDADHPGKIRLFRGGRDVTERVKRTLAGHAAPSSRRS